MISVGAVAAEGIRIKRGDRNKEIKNKMAIVRAARPVRPPAATPLALSTKEVTAEVPKTAAAMEPMASAKRLALPVEAAPVRPAYCLLWQHR